jgi:hypothetical protein
LGNKQYPSKHEQGENRKQNTQDSTPWALGFLMGLQFEVKALRLQSSISTIRGTPPVYFALSVLEMKSLRLFASQLGRNPGLNHWCPAPSIL